MRYIKIAAIVFLALVLVGLALANREPVMLSATPAGLQSWLGVHTVMVPLYLVVLLSLLAGMVIGLLYEWLRESHLRRENARRARDITVLEREAAVRQPPRDDVLALLETPPPAPTGTTSTTVTMRPAAAALPVQR